MCYPLVYRMGARVYQLVISRLHLRPCRRSSEEYGRLSYQIYKSKFLFLLFPLLLPLLLPTLAPPTEATSNLNSIWLTGEDTQPMPGPSSVSPQQVVSIKYADDARLQVSSSSLHPTVASLEHQQTSSTPGTSKPQEFERRSDVGEEQRSSGSDVSTNDLNQTTNAQVQFDEEHQVQAANQLQVPEQANRRQDSDTLLRLVPQVVEERTASKSNSAQNQTASHSTNSTQNSQSTNNTTVQQQPFIYYLNDGDKWNQPSDKSSTFHTSGNHGPYTEQSHTPAGPRSLPTSGLHQHADADIVSYVAHDKNYNLLQSPIEDNHTPTPHPWLENEVKFSTNLPRSISAVPRYNHHSNNMQRQSSTQAPSGTILAPIQARPIGSMPVSAMPSMVYTTNTDLPLFLQLDPLKHIGPRYFSDSRSKSTFTPSFMHSSIEGAGRRARPDILDTYRYRHPTRSHQSVRPRKSFFEILGSRINSWVDPEGNKASNSLDEEFWGELRAPPPSQRPKRRVRSPRPKGGASIYSAEPSVMQAVYIRSPNYLYYPHSFYTHPTSGSSGNSDLLVTRPTLAYLAPVRQPQVAYPSRSLVADKFYSTSPYDATSRGSRLTSSDVQLPHHLSTQGSNLLNSYLKERAPQPASFVPVVAVSVTQTSPAPRPAVILNSPASQTSRPSEQQALNQELADSIQEDIKTGSQRNNQQLQYEAPVGDPTSNQAASSGSINRQTEHTYSYKMRHPLMDHANAPNVGEQTTTVKSAVFGYYPHEAQKPMMQAMSLLPQYAGLRPLVRSTDWASGTGELAGKTANRQSSIMYEPLTATEQMKLVDASAEVDTPPSLLLQLQASNFAQNDIAYPFGSPLEASSSPVLGVSSQLYSTGASGYRPFDLYPINRHQFPSYQIIQPDTSGTLMNPLLAGASTTGTGGSNGRPSGQLLSVAGTDLSPLFAHNGAQLMLGSRPSLRPFMAMDEQQHSTLQPPLSSPFLSVVNAPTTANPDDNESEQQQIVQEDSSSQVTGGGAGHHQVNKQGKKRSSEFFASAGQILLSALPLLLAPTLGLMFASAPLPVARYQAPTSGAGAGAASSAFNSGSGFGSGSGSLHSSHGGIPGNYINSFSTPGHVHNASPAQLFTPAPQSYSTSSPTIQSASVAPSSTTTTINGTSTTATPTANSTRSSGGTKLLPSVLDSSSTTAHRLNSRQPPTPSPASLLMLASAARNHSSQLPASSVTPSPQRLLVTLTTTGPTIYTLIPEHNVSSGQASYALHEQHQPTHHFHQHVANTILLLPTNPEEHAVALANNSSTNYNGYDGADFDAQFADLDGALGSLPQAAGNLTSDGDSLLEADSLHSHNNTPAESLRLYPVSTWPPLRRRTVSLVTSNGNRTYAAELPASSSSSSSSAPHKYQHHHQQLELYEPLNQGRASYTATRRANRSKRQVQQPEVRPAELVRKRRVKRPPSSFSQPRASDPVRVTVKRRLSNSRQPIKEVLEGEDSRNKAAHIFTTIMAQVADDNELDAHSAKLVDRSPERETGASSSAEWIDDHPSNPLNYDQERDDPQPIDAPAVRDPQETVSKKVQVPRTDKTPIARWSISLPQKLPVSESSVEPEIGPNGSIASMQLGRGRGHFPSSPIRTPTLEAPSSSRPVKSTYSTRTTGRLLQTNSNRPKTIDHHHHRQQQQQPPDRIFITDDTKQALVNFNSLLIKDTLSRAPLEARLSGSKSKSERRSESARRQILLQEDQFPPENIHLWRIATKSPTRQDREATESSSYVLDESGNDQPIQVKPASKRRHNLPYSALADQVNLIESDDGYYSGASGSGYDEKGFDRQNHDDYYESKLHSDPMDHSWPHNSNRQDSSQNWRQNSSDISPPLAPIESARGELARRRHLNTAHQRNQYPSSVLYDLMLRNRSQPTLDSSGAFSASDDSRPPARAQTPLSPPLPQYSQPGQYIPNQYAPEQSYQHHDYRSRHPHAPEYGNSRQQFTPYGSGEPHPSRSQYSSESSNNQQSQQNDHLSEQPQWSMQQHHQSQLDRGGGGGETRAVNDYLKKPQFSDSDRDKLMASYLTCDGLLNDSDHCLERLSCEFSDPRNIEQANKLDRAVSSILLGHILINTYIPDQFKQRLKSASLFGYMRQGSCSKFACHKLNNRQ